MLFRNHTSRFKNLAGNLILLAITLIFLYLSGEIFARYYFSQTDATNKELKLYQRSEILGWEFLAGASAVHGPGNPPPQIKINSLGMRDSETTIKKPKNTVRIALLGDSFTFGMITDQEKIFPYLLEQKLNKELKSKKRKYEVLNFGVIGYTTDQQYLQLREKVLQFSPDIVAVMFFAGNDATEMRAHKWIMDKDGKLLKMKDIYHIITQDNQLRRKRTPYSLSTPFLTLVKERGRVLLAKLGLSVSQPLLLWSNFLPVTHRYGDRKIFEYFNKVKSMLKEIKKIDDESRIKTLITIIPTDFQTNLKYLLKYPGAPITGQQLINPNLGTRPQKIINEFVEKQSIEVLDLLPIFKPVTGDLYFTKDDPHFTPAGHQKTAEALFQRLVELRWI